jgi:hypothetical protein
LKLDAETIAWIESAIGEIIHGEVILIIHEKRIVKIITEDRRVHGCKALASEGGMI